LFIALLVFAERRLPEREPTHPEPEPPGWKTTAVLGVAGVLAAWAVVGHLGAADLGTVAVGFVFVCIILSLVVLTGLSGQVSLMQMSFVGIGAVVMSELGTNVPWLIALAIAACVTGAIGCLVALPVLRLRGIYLALLTLALAILLDSLFFGNSNILGGGVGLRVPRPVTGDRQMAVICAVAAAVFANVFLIIRRSALGRMLNALRDSPTACQTMGLSTARLKLTAFGISATMAGAAGGLLGAVRVTISQYDFLYLTSLVVLLVAIIFGITSVSGALLGAAFFEVLPRLISSVGSLDKKADAFRYIVIALLAMYAARHPGGVSSQLRGWLHKQRAALARLRAVFEPPTAPVPTRAPVDA
jgi:branched-chain amino acid transport system permease protein